MLRTHSQHLCRDRRSYATVENRGEHHRLEHDVEARIWPWQLARVSDAQIGTLKSKARFLDTRLVEIGTCEPVAARAEVIEHCEPLAPPASDLEDSLISE